MGKRKKKFIPSIKVPADGLTVTDEDGNEHKPQEGGYVVFRKHVPLSFVRLLEEANKAQARAEAMDEEDPEAVEAVVSLTRQLVEALAHQVLNWSWTDDDYQPLPGPGARGPEDPIATLTGLVGWAGKALQVIEYYRKGLAHQRKEAKALHENDTLEPDKWVDKAHGLLEYLASPGPGAKEKLAATLVPDGRALLAMAKKDMQAVDLFTEALWRLPSYELEWLQEHALDGANLDPQRS